MKSYITDIIIPAYNEQESIAKVVAELPREFLREIIVVNNNSTDNTAEVARRAGATVLLQAKPGYGNACMMGIAHIADKLKPPDIVAFIDGDYSDYPAELPLLLATFEDDDVQLVIGSRTKGNAQKGSMTLPQLLGNKIATTLMRILYGVHYTDLGPLRAIRYGALQKLDMCDPDYGWTVEMQIKVARHRMKFTEVPVSYRKRIGASKVSGTVKGVLGAGYKILWLVFKYATGK